MKLCLCVGVCVCVSCMVGEVHMYNSDHIYGDGVCVRVCVFVCMRVVTCLHAYVCSEKIRVEVWKPPAGDHSPSAMETKVVTACLSQREGNGNFCIMMST